MIARESEQAVFDIAIHSLDFGSGFLDNEQVDHLRAYAVHLGVDVLEATPSEHRARYCTGHKWEAKGPAFRNGNVHWRCAVCLHSTYCEHPPAVDWGIKA